MKKIAVLMSLILITGIVFGQAVKVKKDIVSVDKIDWCKMEKKSGNTILKTMQGVEFAVVESNSFSSGKFDEHTGKEIYTRFSDVAFVGLELPWFNMKETNVNDIIVKMYKAYVLVDGNLNADNARKFYETHKKSCIPVNSKVTKERNY